MRCVGRRKVNEQKEKEKNSNREVNEKKKGERV